jgi:hypothetical protein
MAMAMASVFVFASGEGAAYAAAGAEDRGLVEVSAPMSVAYFDHEVATANGFEIRVDSAGNEYSVPITDHARASLKETAGDVSAFGTVKGPCGTSTLLIARSGPEAVRIGTAFRVFAATDWHVWNVSLVNSFGAWNENFDGGPTSGTWDAEHEKNIRSSQGVTAQVTPGSYAVLVNGAVCFSGLPTSGS